MIRVAIVAEAWGQREATVKHALVGPSGRELTLEMGLGNLAPYMKVKCRKCSGMSRFITPRCEFCQEFIWPNEFTLIDHWRRMRQEQGIIVTNVFNEQPPGNKLDHFFGRDKETDMPLYRAGIMANGGHLQKKYYFHLERLWQTLKDLQPHLIIALGNCPCWALLSQTRISALRGTVTWSDRVEAKVLPTFHPASVLRPTGRAMRPICISDFEKANRESAFPEIRRPERWITIVDPTEDGIREGYDWLNKPANAYSNDIETFKSQISMIGIARSRSDALVIPLRNVDENFQDLGLTRNYWPTKELEVEAWKLIIAAEQSYQPKIFQNGLFDISHFIRNGIVPLNIGHDTMLWHHSLYPELPKSLGFLGSIYANEISWKQMRRGVESLKRDE